MLKQGLQTKLMQKLSPQQIQFIQLLQLNSTELEKRLEEELTDNPALEMDKVENDEPEIDYQTPDSEAAAEIDEDFASEEDALQYDDDTFEEQLNDYVSDDDSYSAENSWDPNEERKDQPIAGDTNLYETLMEQLNSLNLSEHHRALGRHLIGMVEEDGYLRRPLKNIANDLNFMQGIQTNEQELDHVLSIIHTFDPPGIAARSLEECLLIQLGRKDGTNPDVHLAKRIIGHYMNDLAKRHYDKLLRSLKVTRDELRSAVDVITKLDPKPGESQINTKTQYIIPDFIVTTDEGGDLHVILSNRNMPELRVNRGYQETIRGYQESQNKPKALKTQVQFIKQKLDSAKWFIDAIRQRQNTLLHTMQTIVQYQRQFFLTGDIERLQPMILKDIADRIGMDISTVSRVANSKYVQTDFGIFSLKEFFSEGIQTDTGEEVSNKEVKKILKDMIDAESKDEPLTDEKLTNMLNDHGYNIARRTVAKYREQLNVPVARLRREL